MANVNSNLIVAKGLSKEYSGTSRSASATVALENFDLAVKEHEIACVVGPSGCGKSTLLNLFAGFEQPTSGVLTFRGELIRGPSPHRGVVFQQAALFPWLTVLENIELGPRCRGSDREKVQQDTQHVLKSVGLSGFESHFPYQLSGGMRQRVQIARVLVASPDVILMDEPFGSLDAQTRLVMHEVLLSIWAEYQPTIFFITHDVEEALFLADKVYVMSHRPGRIKREIAVPFDKPRRYEVIAEPAFAALKAEVVTLLRAEWEASEQMARSASS
jgi:NitT/TauT family transport system ATP-binding protein